MSNTTGCQILWNAKFTALLFLRGWRFDLEDLLVFNRNGWNAFSCNFLFLYYIRFNFVLDGFRQDSVVRWPHHMDKKNSSNGPIQCLGVGFCKTCCCRKCNSLDSTCWWQKREGFPLTIKKVLVGNSNVQKPWWTGVTVRRETRRDWWKKLTGPTQYFKAPMRQAIWTALEMASGNSCEPCPNGHIWPAVQRQQGLHVEGTTLSLNLPIGTIWNCHSDHLDSQSEWTRRDSS